MRPAFIGPGVVGDRILRSLADGARPAGFAYRHAAKAPQIIVTTAATVGKRPLHTTLYEDGKREGPSRQHHKTGIVLTPPKLAGLVGA